MRSKYKYEIASQYNISTSTLKKWVLKAKILPYYNAKKILNPSDLREIYDKFGYPNFTENEIKNIKNEQT
jgi:hypothetical protein